MPREGHFDGEDDFYQFVNWARDKYTNWEGEGWVDTDSLDIIQDVLDQVWELLEELETAGFPPNPVNSFRIYDLMKNCAANPDEWGWGMWRNPMGQTELKDEDGNWIGYSPELLVSSLLLRGSAIIQHIYRERPPDVELELTGFEQDGVKGYMGVATAAELDAICSVPWMDPTLSSSEFAVGLLNGTLDRNKWQRVVNHKRIDDIRNFANTEGKSLLNPVLLYVDKTDDSVHEMDKLNGDGKLRIDFDFLKERQGVFHDYLPFPFEKDLRPVWIIDGQHRIRGFGSSHRGSELPIPFVLMVGEGTDIDTTRSAMVFTEINTKSEPIDDLHKIYLNYQFAMEGTSNSNDYSLDQDRNPTTESRPQRRAFELALHLASDTDSPLLNCIQFQKPPGRRSPSHIVVKTKNWIESTRKWFRPGAYGIYNDLSTDDYFEDEVLNFFIAFKNTCNHWEDGNLRWLTGQGSGKQLFQFESPFLALLNTLPFCVNELTSEDEDISRPIGVEKFEDILSPLQNVDWKSPSLKRSNVSGRTNQSVKHLTLWLVEAINHGVQYDENETLNSELESMPGRGLLARPAASEITVVSGNEWPALLDLSLRTFWPKHALKVYWSLEYSDGSTTRELEFPNNAVSYSDNDDTSTLTIKSSIIPHTAQTIRVRAIFKNAIGETKTEWMTFERP